MLKNRQILSITIVLLLLCTTITCAAYQPAIKNAPKVKNVIFLIGDGMGPATLAAYRYFKEGPQTKTAFDDYFVGLQRTYSLDDTENITDSAAAATALASGHKTYNGAIGVDKNKQDVKSILESARDMGKSTGLVVTSTITHATPAGFGAHDEFRDHEDAIANDYIDLKDANGKPRIDVLLGGGTKHFIRSDRNLTEEFKREGYHYVTNRSELLADNNHPQLLGLFSEQELPKMLDRTDQTPSLKEMTTAALNRLSQNDKGFFLMVEGSQIDWGGHDNDIVSEMSEMTDFERAFQTAIDFAKQHPDTLIITTADHATGGLSVGAVKKYVFNPIPLRQAKKTPHFIATEILRTDNVEDTWNQFVDFKLTSDEKKKLDVAVEAQKNDTDAKSRKLESAICKIFDTRSNTGWTTGGHTGEDIHIYAFGPGRHLFRGIIENTDIPKNLLKLYNR